jgi:hypothetical protein
LYTKPTDTHNYLLYNSCHPSHTKKSLPYSQFLRVKRICTNLKDFENNAKILMSHFQRRGYPKDLVDEAYSLASQKDRNELLQGTINNTPKSSKKCAIDKHIVITTYSPGLTTPRDIITNNWQILGTSNITNHLYESKVLFANRRCKNLKSLLIRARLPSLSDKTKPHTNVCKTKNCNYCPKINKTGRITSSALGREYVSKHNVTCKSNNIIYCITCKTCKCNM